MSDPASSAEVLISGHGLIEGPRMAGDGTLYFSDVTRGGVFRRLPDGEVEVVVPKRRGVGGIALHADGGIVISGRNICHVRDGETRILFDPPETPGFNDLYTDARGRVYVGTMRSDPFDPDGQRVMGELWRVDAAEQAVELYDDVSLTNGIGFSPDEGTLYHSDTARGWIWAHDIAGNGSCQNRRVFARLERGAPDGLAVDQEGGVWAASYGGGCVECFSPEGAPIRQIEVPAKQVTSLCFAGSGSDEMIIASADHSGDPSLKGCLFRVRAPVRGLDAPPARV